MAETRKLISSRVTVEDSISSIYDFACEKGWTDGLPIIPPTQERVEMMLSGTTQSPEEVVALVQPEDGEATVEKIAINAVMAGCLPAYLPVVIAAIKAMTEPEFNLNAIQCTTNPVAPLVIVNGPIVKELNINCGYNCLGQGWRSNATIGRAIRFVLSNVGGGIPETVDKATHGQPGKYSFCFGENADLSPWQPLQVDQGFSMDTSTVTVIGATGLVPILSPHSKEASGPLIMLAHSMNYAGNNNFVLGGEGEILLILGPATAGYLAHDGLSKDDVKKYLFENTKMPISYFSKGLQEGMKQGGRGVDGMVNLVSSWKKILIVVAGGEGGAHNVFAPTFGPTCAITRQIVK